MHVNFCSFLFVFGALVSLVPLVQNAPLSGGQPPACPSFESRRNCISFCTCDDYRNGKCEDICLAVVPGTELPCTCTLGYVRKSGTDHKCVEVSSMSTMSDEPSMIDCLLIWQKNLKNFHEVSIISIFFYNYAVYQNFIVFSF